MSNSYNVGDKIDYTTKQGEKYKLTVETIFPKFKKKYFVSGEKVDKDGKLSPSGIYRLPSLNQDNAEEAAESLEDQIKQKKGKDIEEIKKMAKEMGMINKDGDFKMEGGRRTRRRRRKRRRTKKKRRRRRTKKKRRRRRRKTRK